MFNKKIQVGFRKLEPLGKCDPEVRMLVLPGNEIAAGLQAGVRFTVNRRHRLGGRA